MKKSIYCKCILKLLLPFILIVITADFSDAKMKTTPNFVLYDIKGNRNIFYDLIGKIPDKGYGILNFTSVNCLPCRKEVPELVSIKEKAKNKVMLFIIYSEGSKPAGESASTLGALKYAYADPFKTIHGKFNIKKVPVTVIINNNKKILGWFEGYTESNIEKIMKIINGR